MGGKRRSSQTVDDNTDVGDLAAVGELIPGKDLEKAAGQVATAAGKSAVRGIANALGAATAEWFAKKAAKAQAAKLAIKTASEIESRRAVIKAQRKYEMEEIAHREKIARAKRGLDRTLHALDFQQANLESICQRSIELIEEKHDAKAADLDKDWLFQFAEYAEKASNKEIQEIWARILSSAATSSDNMKLSRAALLVMSTLDQRAAIDFQNFCDVVASTGAYPVQNRLSVDPQDIDLGYLEELGLIRVSLNNFYDFEDFRMLFSGKYPDAESPTYLVYNFTRRGYKISRTAFDIKGLTDDKKTEYYKYFIYDKLDQDRNITLVAKNPLGNLDRPLRIDIEQDDGVISDLSLVEKYYDESVVNALRELEGTLAVYPDLSSVIGER